MADSGTSVPSSSDLVSTLNERVSLVSTLANPNITLARAAAAYIMFKRRRLTPASERGYQTILDELTKNHPGARLADFEPPKGSMLIEDFLVARWGHLLRGEWYATTARVLVAIELLSAAVDFQRDLERDGEQPSPDLTLEVLCTRANQLLDVLEAAA